MPPSCSHFHSALHSHQRMSSLLTVNDYEKKATSSLSPMVRDYYLSGANEQVTLKDNRDALSNFKIRPRFLIRDVSARNLSTTFLGQSVSMPIGVSPTAMQRMAHPDGELANAKACQSMGAVMILSTLSTSSVEEVAEAAPKLNKW